MEGGDYQIWAAASSADLRLSGTVTVAGTGVDSPYPREALSSYYSGKVSQVSDKEFETLLGRPIPASKWDRSQPLGRNDTIAQMSYAKSGLARFVCGRITAMRAKSDRKGVPDLNILSIYNMPFRGISKLMGPMVSLEMVDAILESVNGHFWRGIGHLLGLAAQGQIDTHHGRAPGARGKGELSYEHSA